MLHIFRQILTVTVILLLKEILSVSIHYLLQLDLKEKMSTAECNKVLSDIFDKFEFLMKYQNMGSWYDPLLFRVFKLVTQDGGKWHLRRSCIKRETRFALTTLKIINN